MKKSFVFLLLACLSSLSCTVAHAHHYEHPDAPVLTKLVVHDYAYDYNSDSWVQVNTYTDSVDCFEATEVVDRITAAGFYVTVLGPTMCPEVVEYSVHHGVLYAPWVVYTLWNHSHYGWHHHHTRATYHRYVKYNISHRRAIFHKRYRTHKHYRVHMVPKFRAWKHKVRYKKWKRSNRHHNHHYKKHHSRRGQKGSGGHSSYKQGKKKYGKKYGKKRGKRGKRHHRRR